MCDFLLIKALPDLYNIVTQLVIHTDAALQANPLNFISDIMFQLKSYSSKAIPY